MESGPREIVTPFRPIPLAVPEGMKPNEFFNSAENLVDLVCNNGLLATPREPPALPQGPRPQHRVRHLDHLRER